MWMFPNTEWRVQCQSRADSIAAELWTREQRSDAMAKGVCVLIVDVGDGKLRPRERTMVQVLRGPCNYKVALSAAAVITV